MICSARRCARIAASSSAKRSRPSNHDAARGRLEQAQHQPPGGRLAAARFADQRQRLARVQREAHAVDGVHGLRVSRPPIPSAPGSASPAPRRAAAALMPAPPAALLERRIPATRELAVAHRAPAAAPRGTCPSTHGQRGAKRQPGGAAYGSGTWPSIAARRACSRSSFGIEPSRPDGVGMLRPREELAHRRLLDDAPRVHHRHVLRELGDHAEVVGDEDDRGAGLVAQLCA